MKNKIPNIKYQAPNTRTGFTLVELLVAIFIFFLITVGIVSVFVSSTMSYGKNKAIKDVKENAEFAMFSIAKDMRMGKVEYYYTNIGVGSTAPLDGNLVKNIVILKNRGGTVCYKIIDSDSDSNLDTLSVCNSNCSSSCSGLVNLVGTNMSFADTSGFYSLPTDTANATKRRGWVEINLNIKMASGQEMSADQINVQTIVSSRDYGWEEMP